MPLVVVPPQMPYVKVELSTSLATNVPPIVAKLSTKAVSVYVIAVGAVNTGASFTAAKVNV